LGFRVRFAAVAKPASMSARAAAPLDSTWFFLAHSSIRSMMPSESMTGSTVVSASGLRGRPRPLFSTFFDMLILTARHDFSYVENIRGSQEETKMTKTEANKLRKDLSEEEKEKALKIGRIEFKSAGSIRKR
jgi:hypothetical protein